MATLFREALTEDGCFYHGGVVAARASLDDGDGGESRFLVAVVGVNWRRFLVGDGRAAMYTREIVVLLTGTPG